MKVFISWSGFRSKNVAELFHEWLPLVIHEVEPWMSSEDIDKGKKWSSEISQSIDNADFGIICVTKDNLINPWLLFEAGALSRTIKEATFVCPFLLDLEATDIDNKNPLSQFQATKNSREEVLNLLKTINKASGNEILDNTRLKKTFIKWWSEFEDKISSISTSTEVKSQIPVRTDRDLMEEILERIRNLERETQLKKLPTIPLPKIKRINLEDNSDTIQTKHSSLEEIKALGELSKYFNIKE